MKQDELLHEKTLNSKYIYKGKIIDLKQDSVMLSNGNIASREVVEHSGGVCVAALTKDKKLVFVRQFRYPYKEIVLEVPAGKLEINEQPLTCAKRELKEETGVVANTYKSLGTLYPSPGYCGEIIYLYMATDLAFETPQPDEDEFLQVQYIPIDDAVSMVMSGEIKDSKTQVCILKVARLIDNASSK